MSINVWFEQFMHLGFRLNGIPTTHSISTGNQSFVENIYFSFVPISEKKSFIQWPNTELFMDLSTDRYYYVYFIF